MNTPTHPPLFETITRRTCAVFAVKRRDIFSASRETHLVYARFAAIWAMYQLPKTSHRRIALKVGKERTAVLYAIHKATDWRDVYPDFRAKTDQLIAV